MNTSIIRLDYDNTPVFFHSDAFINATAIAKKFKKLPKDYLKTARTKEYIEAVRRNILTEENQLVTIVQGGTSEEQGTWFHPKLAIDFARWLSADFAVWCDMQIEKILHPAQSIPTEPLKKTKLALPGCLTLETQDEIKQLIYDRAATQPKEKQAGFVISMWSALGTHFGIKKAKGDKIPAYKRIPEGARLECLSFLARLSVDNLVTLTADEFNAAVAEKAKALPAPEVKEGDIMPTTKNTFVIDLGKDMGLKSIVFKFCTNDESYSRWLIQNDGGNIFAKPMLNNELPLSFEQWITYATKERGYVVVKKSEVVDKLLA